MSDEHRFERDSDVPFVYSTNHMLVQSSYGTPTPKLDSWRERIINSLKEIPDVRISADTDSAESSSDVYKQYVRLPLTTYMYILV